MYLTQKKYQYAIRAIYELAKNAGMGPMKISEIARAQSIPMRFLEVILGRLKGSGLVNAKRGYYGGYYLLQPPDKISVGDVLRYLGEDSSGRDCIGCESSETCPFKGNCVFLPLWNRAVEALYKVYDETTFQDLIDNQK